jgi:cation:H+ antiporter
MMAWVIRLGLRSENPDEATEEVPDPIPSGHAALWVVVGIALLLASSRLLVWGASSIALSLGVPNLVVGLSIVAIGTSLPELAASVMAARRGEHELAVGNVIGSNMFNTLGVLSLPGLIRPAPVSEMVLLRDVPVMFGVTFLFFVMARFFLKRSVITRVEGAVLMTCFVGYQVALYFTS